MFQKLFSDVVGLFKTSKKTHTLDFEPKTIWRPNMWVMSPSGIGILFKLEEPATIHLVDPQTGLTTSSVRFSTDALRQAKYAEIPEGRKGAIEKAQRLGYL